MQILHSFDDLASLRQPIHLALGVFDGVHKGHREVIMNAVRHAEKDHSLAGVLTFESHPLHLIHPERAPRRLLANTAHKANLLSSLGVDILISLPFNRELSELTADEFLTQLTSRMDVRSLSVGCDWKFGKNRQGDTAFLRQAGDTHGFQVYCLPPILNSKGERISSTLIRQAVSQGKFDEARDMLGRDYSVTGTVIHGRKLATELGYPTANVDVRNEQLPPPGIYLVSACPDSGKQVYGIANLGTRPTVEEGKGTLLLEVHLLDWQGDLYGKEIEVDFLHFLREEKSFESLDALKKQIARDETQARLLIENLPHP